jgi:esterase/lipase superfamily enzyme
MFTGNPAQELDYASITVSIPPESARKIGQIQWPTSVPGDPARDFVTVAADYLDKQAFNRAISTAAKSTKRSKVLVFVHGFNNRFDDAVYRFAQIVQDSQAPVIPVLFSWPSKGVVTLDAYKSDVKSANEARSVLKQLLQSVALNRDVKEITVLCHSMGCVPALDALQSIHAKNVLLVAPDVDLDDFRNETRKMGSPRPRIAVFVSHDDQALKLSKSIWECKARLGDATGQESYLDDLKRQGILVFDITNLEGDAHSQAFENAASVMGMVERRLIAGQQMTDAAATVSDAGQ